MKTSFASFVVALGGTGGLFVMLMSAYRQDVAMTVAGASLFLGALVQGSRAE